MRTLISLNEGETIVAHFALRQCPPQHVLVFWLKAIKFNFTGAKKKTYDEVLVLYLCLVSGRRRIHMPK